MFQLVLFHRLHFDVEGLSDFVVFVHPEHENLTGLILVQTELVHEVGCGTIHVGPTGTLETIQILEVFGVVLNVHCVMIIAKFVVIVKPQNPILFILRRRLTISFSSDIQTAGISG